MTESGVMTVESDIATITFSPGSGGESESSDDSSPEDNLDECDRKLMINSCGENNEDQNVTATTAVIKQMAESPGAVISSKQCVESSRFNPFDKDVNEEEEVFPQLRSPTLSRQTTHSVSSDQWEFVPHSSVPAALQTDLEISEDHFSLPEGLPVTNIEDLEKAVAKYKKMVLASKQQSETQKQLMDKLIQLRLKLVETKFSESTEDDSEKLLKFVVGHKLEKRVSTHAQQHCEKCNGLIWTVLKPYYRCTDCLYSVHEKCLNSITRTCPTSLVTDSPRYILDICPEKGICAQAYKCLECRTPISYQSGYGEPRQCDYTGMYYCNLCHWNDQVPIPARILHNWDFEPHKVCRATKQLLRLLYLKPIIRVQDINPMLFNFVEELNQVKTFREEILIMKKYFLSCREALKSKLLLQLKGRQHFVENSDMYSLQDLVDIASDILVPHLAKIHASFAQHIKTDCITCQGKGFLCELCDYNEILFPFDNHAVVCPKCSTVLHRHCLTRRNNHCPKCERMTKRNQMAKQS